jgi:hypothetical protein
MNRRICLAAMASIATRAPAADPPTEVAGVRYPPTLGLAGATLVLNGAGIRYRTVIKVYAAGLYLGVRASSPEAVLAAPGPKRMSVTMLREIDSNELGKLLTRGMQDNSPRDEFSKAIPGTFRLGEIFAARKRLGPGDQFSIDYVPGLGTTVLINGKPAGEPIAEPEFFRCLLRIWLGPSPAHHLLKDALLGQQRQPSGQGLTE